MYNTLSNANHKVYPKTIQGFFIAKVVNVYDGDTLTVVFDPQIPTERVRKFRKKPRGRTRTPFLVERQVRMFGYDSEEMRQPKAEPNRDALKKKAVEEKEALQEHVLDKLVLLEAMEKKEKYGRILGKIYLLTPKLLKRFRKGRSVKFEIGTLTNINTWMVKHKYGKEYYGGTKGVDVKKEKLK
jgi:endonuclease YncB( thermonuclease family)